MNHRVMRNITGLMLALSTAVGAFGQGVYTESKASGGPLPHEQLHKMYYMPGMFKTTTGDENYMIVRLDKEIIYVVKPKDKTYSEITFAEIEAMMKKANEKMAANQGKMDAAREKLASLPPEQRKMVEKMMGDRMAAMGGKDSKIDVTRSGESKAISGYACTKYVVTQDGKEFMTMWTTKDVKEFASMRKDFEAFSQRMASMNPMMGKGYMEAFRKLEGFPIETDMMGMTQVVTKIEKRTTPSSEFEVPSGYTKVESDMQKSMERMEKEQKD